MNSVWLKLSCWDETIEKSHPHWCAVCVHSEPQTQAKNALSLSLSVCLQVPSPPGDEDEDFILVHHSDVQISEKAEEVYTQLAKILKEQHEVKLQQSLYKKLFLKFNKIRFFFSQILQIICDFK